MASVRVAVVDTALRLARAAEGERRAGIGGYAISVDTILNLHRAAAMAQRPQSTIRWAWRSQTARFVDTGGHIDGVASMYLLAALLQSDADPGRSDVSVRRVG